MLRALSPSSPLFIFFSCNRLVFLPPPLKETKNVWAAGFVFLLVMLEERQTQLAFELLYSFYKTSSLLEKKNLKNPLLAEQM